MPEMPRALVVRGRPARWPVFVALVVALIGVAVGVIGWFRPALHNDQSSTSPKTTYTSRQTANAKAHMCAAFGEIDRAVDLADGERASGSDRTAQLTAAALARQVLDFGSRYLLAKLAEEPATPSELATAIRQEADAFQDLFVGYIDGISNSDPALQPVMKNSDDAALTIRRLCK
jgi:hypothetical protein